MLFQQDQLLQVLQFQCGFPEEQLLPRKISFREHSPALDIVAGLLCTGFYPNIAYHLEKRKILTTESKVALVHKTSVICSRFETNFQFPFFVYGEKVHKKIFFVNLILKK